MSTRVAVGILVGLLAVGWLGPAVAPVGASEHPPAGEAGHEGSQSAQEGPAVDPLAWRGETAIWTAVIFLLLLIVLGKFAWGPIARGLEKREQGIADQISQAEKSNTEARELLGEYEKKLAASGQEVQQMLEAARRDADKAGQEIVESAKDEAQAEHRRALDEIDAATAGALEELADQSATLAVELAGKILQAKLDPREHSHLIERAVADFSKRQPSNN
ncbi:MAG: F0F1 ATP synthase subunit B [Planctomycetota bacterium]|jgi:F-type H+-transporting ATPase subunit b